MTSNFLQIELFILFLFYNIKEGDFSELLRQFLGGKSDTFT